MELEYDIDFIKSKIMPRIKSNDSKFPDTVLIDNISYCNLKCSMCPHAFMKRKKGIMNKKLYYKIINEIAEKKPDARVWMTFFGEGLIMKDLDKRIYYAKSKGLTDVVLNSNGNLLSKVKKAESIIKAGLDILYVGIDAFSEETYQKLRIGGNLQQTVEGVLLYKELLQKYGSDKQKIIVQFVVMDENKNELDNYLEFWKKNNVDVKVRPKVSWAGKVHASNLKKLSERLPCNWAMNTISIADNGLVCLCATDLECEVIMGDINRETIEKVWNSKLKSFREQHTNSRWDKLPQKCQKCNDWQSSYAEYK